VAAANEFHLAGVISILEMSTRNMIFWKPVAMAPDQQIFPIIKTGLVQIEFDKLQLDDTINPCFQRNGKKDWPETPARDKFRLHVRRPFRRMARVDRADAAGTLARKPEAFRLVCRARRQP
jgi:hypothetical protein